LLYKKITLFIAKKTHQTRYCGFHKNKSTLFIAKKITIPVIVVFTKTKVHSLSLKKSPDPLLWFSQKVKKNEDIPYQAQHYTSLQIQ